MSSFGPNNQQNSSAEGRRIGSKDRRRKTSKALSVSGTQSSSVILHGDEKDFDRTQWEWTRLCEKVDNGEQIKKNVVVSKMKQEAPKVSSGSAVVTIQPPLCDTNPPKSTEIARPIEPPVDYYSYDALVMILASLLQLMAITSFLIVMGSIYRDTSTVTHFTIIIGSLMLLAFLVVIFSICFEAVQVCCKEESKMMKRTAMWRYRTIIHVIKTLIACAVFVLLFETPPHKRLFKWLVYLLLVFFILLISEHYAKCCSTWLTERQEEKEHKKDETTYDDINMEK